jgi:hypothetical protein
MTEAVMVAMRPGMGAQVPFRKGLRRTIEWYFSTNNRA